MKIRCIILAGGLGTRIANELGGLPKCLAPIRGKPFLYWQMNQLKDQGISRFTLSLGHGASSVLSELRRWVNEFDDVDWVLEAAPLGTGGALLFAMKEKRLAEVIAINGDTLLTGDISPIMLSLNLIGGELVRLGLVNVNNRERFGGVEVNEVGQVNKFLEKGTVGSGIINSGLYRICLGAFTEDAGERFSFENDTLQRLIANKNLYAAVLNCGFIDIGIPSDYRMICR